MKEILRWLFFVIMLAYFSFWGWMNFHGYDHRQ